MGVFTRSFFSEELSGSAFPLLDGGGGFLLDDVVGAALGDTGGADQGELGLFLKLRDGERAAVAHGGAHLA